MTVHTHETLIIDRSLPRGDGSKRGVERTWSRGREILSTFSVDWESLLRFSEMTKKQIHYVMKLRIF